MPTTDYIPLFALLGEQLTDEDVHTITEELQKESDPQSAAAIKKAITDVMSVEPNEKRRSSGPGPAGCRRLAARQARPHRLTGATGQDGPR